MGAASKDGTLFVSEEGGGGAAVDITAVGGGAITLGQKTSVLSFPVVVASDQSAIPVSGSVTITGGATAAKQDTGNASLASIDGKIVAVNTGAVVVSSSALPTDAATQTTLALIKAKTDNIDVALSTRTKPADAQHVIVDSGSLTANQSINVAQINGHTTIEGGVNGSQSVGGPTASGATLAANPVSTGGLARTTPPTAVANNQVVNDQKSIYGEQIVRNSLRETKGNQQTQISSSTSETTIVTADATYKLDLYGLILTNTSATGTKVTIKDSTAGTTRMVIYIPANDTRGFMLPACDGHKQSAVNNNWTATCGTSVAAIEITALFVQNL